MRTTTGKIGHGAKVHRFYEWSLGVARPEWMSFCGAAIVNRPNKSGLTLIDDAEVTCSKCLAQDAARTR